MTGASLSYETVDIGFVGGMSGIADINARVVEGSRFGPKCLSSTPLISSGWTNITVSSKAPMTPT